MSKARNLSDFISDATIDSTEIADLSVTHAKLHTDMNLSSKTLTFAANQISGNSVDGGVISNFASTGIDDNASATAVTILSDGKVGIGTTSAAQKLHVYSTSGNTYAKLESNGNNTRSALLPSAKKSDGTPINAFIGVVGDANKMEVATTTNDPIHFYTNNSPTNSGIFLKADGNVGIGTQSPVSLSSQTSLTINGTSVGRLDLQGTGQLYANGTEIVLQGSYGKPVAIDAGTNQHISFRYATAEKMRINSSGNVAIGTTGPVSSGYDTGSTKLTVMSTTLNNATSGYLELASRANSNGYNAGAIQFNNFENAGVAGSGVQNRTVGQIRTIIATTDSNAGDDSGGTMEFYTKSEAGNLTQNMTIHSNGNVGIGTSNPGSLLSVNGPAALANLGGGSTGSSALYVNTTSGHIGEMIQVLRNGAIKMYMANDGDLALGHSSPSDKLDIQGADNGLTVRSIEANRPVIKLINGSSTMLTLSANGSYAAIGGAAGLNDYMLFHPNSGNRVIASGGAINLHNANTAGWVLNGNGNLGQANFSTNNNRPLILHRYNGAGQIAELGYNQSTVGSINVAASGTTYNTTSDRRLKDNIEPIADAADKLMHMKPVTHTWIDNPDDPQVHGFIAQEMQEVVPEAVSGDAESDEMMSMDYGRITPIIVAALQDALKEIKELKTRIDELENN